jgi:xanthine dehydrogenase YagS FAD-binding subunit
MLDELPPFEHVDAATVDEAIHWLREHGSRAKLIAGGTDLLGLMKDRVTGPEMPLPEVLVNLKTIEALRRIDARRDGGITVGATATLGELEAHPVVTERFPALAQAAASIATTQIRAVGTVGGNLCQRPWCWYFRHPQFVCFKRGGRQCFAIPGHHRTYFSVTNLGICVMAHPSDLAPALIALDASVRVIGPGGEQLVPVERFFLGPRSVSETVLGPADLVVSVEVPAPVPGTRSAFVKHRIRNSWDFALAQVAVAVRRDGDRVVDARIALGGIAPFPYRSPVAEQVLCGMAPTEASIAAAAEAALAKARPLAMNGYKVDLAQALVRRALAAVLW